MSIHTPSGIQRGGRPAGRRSGLAVLRESMRTIGKVAARAKGRGLAVLVAGDDNADERAHPGAWEPYNGRSVTGLATVRAPRATHAGGRRIDDYRKHGLVTGPGRVVDVPSDHGAHVRKWRFRRWLRRW